MDTPQLEYAGRRIPKRARSAPLWLDIAMALVLLVSLVVDWVWVFTPSM